MTVPSAAPGELETVRALLNTRWSPTKSGGPRDQLDELARDAGRWREQLSELPRPRTRPQRDRLRHIRDVLRTALSTPARLEDLLALHPVEVRVVSDDPTGPRLTHVPVGSGPHDQLAAVVVEAVADGTWSRLKACDECDWVFYDHSRNASRRWCGMATPGPDGRNCGAAVKMRNYRERLRHTDAEA